MRKGLIGIFILFLWTGLLGCARSQPEQPTKIKIHFFYNEACAACNGTKEFYEMVEEELEDISHKYPYEIYPHNVLISFVGLVW